MLNQDQYLSLYKKTLRIRLVEEAVANHYPGQEMRCPVHLSIGQEAVATGASYFLDPDDYMMSTHRAHAHYLAKGGDLKKMIAEFYGKQTGCCAGRGGSMHLVDLDVAMIGSTPIVGGAFPVGVGVAFASKLKKENKITLVYLGEAMTEEGVFTEALNFAALKKLPILFVCESNQYSVYSPMEVRQPSNRNLTAIVEAHGIQSLKGDGNKIDEVLKLCQASIESIKKDQAPRFVELETYRFREHCGPHYDIQLGYRSQEELDSWKKRCPIAYFENLLRDKGWLSDEQNHQIKNEIQKEIDEAFAFAKASPFPKKEELLTHLYA